MAMTHENEYITLLRARSKKSHVYRKYQLTGLALTRILRDEGHKALYIKLAAQYDGDLLITLAKRIAEKKRIQNKGAYFMASLNDPSLKKTKKLLPKKMKKVKKEKKQRSLFDPIKRKKTHS